jgi:uncharacterized membrane protein
MAVSHGAKPTPPEAPDVPPHVAETVEAIAELHARAEREVSRQQRSVEAITARLGQPAAVWLIAVLILLWAVANTALPRVGLPAFDPPPFELLQALCSLGALLIATMVLAAQNRQRSAAEAHARLDLHINLLAEQKLAKVISLLEELRRDMPDVANRVDLLAEAMTHAVDPHALASALEETVGVEAPSSPTERTSGS